MGNISYLFKKIVDTKGKFHTSVGILKDKTGQDLTEVEEIKKRCKEYTEGLYKKKKPLNDPVSHDDMVTHLEPDIQESEVSGL